MEDRCEHCGGQWQQEIEYVDVGICSVPVAVNEIPCCLWGEVKESLIIAGKEPTSEDVYAEWRRCILDSAPLQKYYYYEKHIPF